MGASGETPGSGPKSGVVFIFRGGTRGMTAHQTIDQEGGLGSNESGDRFGAAVCTGDFNNDGREDLFVGATG